MAAPTYATDLTTFNDASSVTGWDEITGYLATDGAEYDIDYAIYGGGCITSGYRKTGLGSIAYDNGTAVTLPTNGVFLTWFKFLGPNSLGTKANGGFQVLVGDTIDTFYSWYVGGSDTYPYGGWINIAIDPTIGTPDVTTGTPNDTWAVMGIGCNQINAISKGNPFGVDIIRYGRGESRFTNGDSTTPANFSGFSAFNDNSTTGRLGLIQDVGGSYLYKGLISLGLSATSVYFSDSNVNLTIDDTQFVLEPFNKIEIHHINSYVYWKSVNITSLSTVSRGNFEMVDDADVTLDTCVFSDMNTFIFSTGATGITTTSFIRCSGVTQGGGTFNECIFDNSRASASLIVDNLGKISNSDFISDGSNHAMELTSATSGKTYTLVGCTYENYATVSGTTGNEVIYNNSGGHVIINVSGGDTPTIRNGTSATTQVNNNTVITIIGLKDKTEIRVYDNATLNPQIELAGVEEATDGTIDNRSFTFSLAAAKVVDIVYHNKTYKSIPSRSIGYIIPSTDTSFSIVQLFDPNYNGQGT